MRFFQRDKEPTSIRDDVLNSRTSRKLLLMPLDCRLVRYLAWQKMSHRNCEKHVHFWDGSCSLVPLRDEEDTLLVDLICGDEDRLEGVNGAVSCG